MWRHDGNEALIDKTLTVHGDRQLCLRSWPVRLLQWLLKWSTLTLVRPSPWRIRNVGYCKPKPVRYEQAYGGQCIVAADDPRASHVPKKVRLTTAQAANHPNTASGRQPPLAHVAFDPNPCGTGFAQSWYLRAAQVKCVEAPSIDHPAAALQARQFWRWLNPERLAESEASTFRRPAGLGILPKTHPERRRLLGTVDASFISGDAALPDDFDFAIWNCAPPDQRVDYPVGGEEIELVNLCAAGGPGTRTVEGKNVCLRLRLPSDRCSLRFTHANGRESVLAMMLDTVLIEPEDKMLTLVWRRTFPMEELEAVSATLQYQTTVEAQRERIAIAGVSVSHRDEAEHG
jgi:hypothetical protein